LKAWLVCGSHADAVAAKTTPKKKQEKYTHIYTHINCVIMGSTECERANER